MVEANTLYQLAEYPRDGLRSFQCGSCETTLFFPFDLNHYYYSYELKNEAKVSNRTWVRYCPSCGEKIKSVCRKNFP